MKKSSKVSAIVISLILILCTFTLTAFAVGEPVMTEDLPISDIPDEIYEDVMSFSVIIIISSLVGSLFLPALIVMIIFIVKNNDVKKDLKQYEKIFGPVDIQNNSMYYQHPTEGSYPGFAPTQMNTKSPENKEGGNI